jgi:MFS family permease
MAQEPLQQPTGITGYQWLVLAVASAGWVFDVFEGQIFNITRKFLLAEILRSADDATLRYWGDVLLGVFLIGGAVGGIACGSLADRWGRRPMLIATIVLYSIFSGLTYWADSLWQIALLRLLVAVGVGGEWAVAASLVAEEFPAHARAQASGFFHATSIAGTWLAGLAGMAVGAQWRYAYLLGVLPALLIVVVRLRMREPQSWRKAAQTPADGAARGSLPVLLRHPVWRRRAILGLLLASVGLATFWGVTVAGQDLMQQRLLDAEVSDAKASQDAQFAYSIVQTTGGGLGLLAFGPLSAYWGRRRTFVVFLACAAAVVPLVAFAPVSPRQFQWLLPLFGFFTLGFHAGFAVYFPELFPTALRATGAGFCFNGGRLVAAPMLLLSGWLKAQPGVDLRLAVTCLSALFVVGIAVVLLLPETKGQPLPESL